MVTPAGVSDMADLLHEHTWSFLRQERTRDRGEWDRSMLVEDIFFCPSCLAYSRVQVQREHPNPRSFSDPIIERLH